MPNEAIFLKAGDIVPAICPECKCPFTKNLEPAELICPACGFTGPKDDFGSLRLIEQSATERS